MRITGGALKGRRFTPPMKKWPTRPSTDFGREGLFNILTNTVDFEASKALDLFCGSGAVSYELASRGCLEIWSVDQFSPAIKYVKQTAEDFKLSHIIHTFKGDVFKFIKKSEKGPFDLIFADPPYHLPQLKTIPDLIIQSKLLNVDGLLVVEHSEHDSFEEHPHYFKSRKYGQSVFSFFEVKD